MVNGYRQPVTGVTLATQARTLSLREAADSDGGGTLRLEVYERLKEAILNLEFKPGQTIAISEMARRLGVSRTPVREALSLLERDYLVRVVGKQGVLIRELTLDEMIHILQVREVIDGLAARLAVNSIDDAVLDDMRARFEALAATGKVDPDAQARLSNELHRSIAAGSGNPYLLAQYDCLSTAFSRTSRIGWTVWKQSSRRDDVNSARLQEHFALISALKSRDPDLAEATAREHILNSLRDLLSIVNGIPLGRSTIASANRAAD
jgi:DNA-binding GntR family transcriptional regulator